MSFTTPLEISQQLISNIAVAVNTPSLVEYTKSTRLSPTVLIDKKMLIIDQKLTSALLQTLLSMYCSYYLLGVNLSMHVGNIHVMQLLDKFSTNRSIIDAISNSDWFDLNDIDTNGHALPEISYESEGGKPFLQSQSAKAADYDKVAHTIMEDSNLAVGKIINVQITYGNQTTTIPITATLAPKVIDSDDFITLAKYNSVDTSFRGRWHQMRSGEIKAIDDWLFCSDLIENNRKALLADKTGTLLSAASKRTKNLLAAVASGTASPNAISTMVIITKQTSLDLEIVLKGSLKKSHIRDQYFSNNATMMLVVVDTQMEKFTIYQRSIDDYSDLTLKDIEKNSTKSNGLDMKSILDAYKLGNMPNII